MAKKREFLRNFLIWGVYLLLLAGLPCLGFTSPHLTAALSDRENAAEQLIEEEESSREEMSDQEDYADKIVVYDEATKKVLVLEEEEYTRFATACEMPMLYETEAIKAQAVAALTYAVYQRERQADKSKPILTVNTETYTGLCTEEGLQKLWGEQYAVYEKKLSDIVDAVKGQLVTYDGKPILAAYFAFSGGMTEDSGNVWGQSLPYLQPVEMGADLQAKDCVRQVTVRVDVLKENLLKIKDDVSFPKNTDDWFTDYVYSESGTVLRVKIGEDEWTGQQIRQAAGLASASFTAEVSGEEITFQTIGHGHFVGLSQHGANMLAKEGMDYRQILSYFYTQTVLTNGG